MVEIGEVQEPLFALDFVGLLQVHHHGELHLVVSDNNSLKAWLARLKAKTRAIDKGAPVSGISASGTSCLLWVPILSYNGLIV